VLEVEAEVCQPALDTFRQLVTPNGFSSLKSNLAWPMTRLSPAFRSSLWWRVSVFPSDWKIRLERNSFFAGLPSSRALLAVHLQVQGVVDDDADDHAIAIDTMAAQHRARRDREEVREQVVPVAGVFVAHAAT